MKASASAAIDQGGRRELIAGLLGLVFLVAFQLALAPYWLDLVDEGYFADLAYRVVRGEMPYRDFATPYTPGIHYLHAWAMDLFGRDLLVLRIVLTAAKTALAVLLYLLARRLAPPAFAVLPVILLFAIDTAPLMWEPHPAWYAMLFAVLCAWSITRLIESGSDRWTLLAGAAAAVSCAFKQNIGIFILLACCGFLLFESTALPAGRARLPLPAPLTNLKARLAARLVFAVLLLVALGWLLRSYLDPRLAVVFLAPVLFMAAVGLASTTRRAETRSQLEASAGRLVWLGGAFLAVTLAWLLALVLALGPSHLPVELFVGSMDLTGFYWELAEPRLGFVLFVIAAITCPMAVQRMCRPSPFPRRFAEAAAFLLLSAVAVDMAFVDPALATPDLPPDETDLWHLSVRAAEIVLLYLPSLAFWGGVTAGSSSGAFATPAAGVTLRWLLLSGSLLLFNLFPRMDTMHVTFSAPLLFIVGVFALYRLFVTLECHLPESAGLPLYRGLLFCALLVLPAAAALPNLEWRIGSFISRQADRLRFDVPDYVPLDVPGASVLVPPSSRFAIGGVAHYLREHTAPGEPIFVYPTLPMFYFLADRPNPTRFGHVYPSAATPAEQRDMVAALESSGVRYVVWDQFWVNEWGGRGKHLLNQPLTDYILGTFRTETMIGPFHILIRAE